MSVVEKLNLDRYLTLINTLKNLDTPYTCAQLTKTVGFPVSNYLDRMYALGDDNPLKVITRKRSKNAWNYSYKPSPDFTKEALKKWVDKINSNPKRKYVKNSKLKTETETQPAPIDTIASEAVDALTSLILENQQLKKKISRIERCLQ